MPCLWVVKVGQVVKVKVLAVDLQAKRIALSIKALLPAPARSGQHPRRHERPEAATRSRTPRFQGQGEGERERKRSSVRPPREEARPRREAKPEVKGATLDDLLAKFNKRLG